MENLQIVHRIDTIFEQCVCEVLGHYSKKQKYSNISAFEECKEIYNSRLST